MKPLHDLLLKGLPLLLALSPLAAHSEDIDIYAGVDSKGGKPNILFFLDNTSNWSANNQAWSKAGVTTKCNALTDATAKTLCNSYVTEIFGASTSLVQGQVELRALKLVLNALVCGPSAKMSVNAGMMLLNDAGTVDSPSGIGGYIRHRIAPLNASYCTTILNDLDNIDAKISTPDFKGPSSAEYGTALFEAFKYFGGWTNPAGAKTGTAGSPTGATGFGPIRYTKPISLEDSQAFVDPSTKTTYKSPVTGDDVCGNNYIILIGNKFPNQEYGTNANASPPSNTNLTTRLAYNHGAQIYPVPLANSDKSDVRFADEWAKFLYNADVSDIPGQQNIKMFTVDVYNSSADAAQGQLLKSIADQSGSGGYFAVGGNLYDLIKAFTDILTQIAAVDSVFASASLPVSVNAQGTFLNQVFMGVFRPDANAQQRWVGNLKQYKFKLTGDTLDLVGQDNQDVVDAQNTGFLKPCARSYWSTDSGGYWETITGFSEPSTCDSLGAISPFSDQYDGPFVERGGAAQRLRSAGYASRNLRTCNNATCASMVDLSSSSVLSSTTLRDWVRGLNSGDGNYSATASGTNYSVSTQYNLAGTATRPTIHGGVLHSRPLAINYGTSSNDVVVFYGADDGIFRAVNGNQANTDGNELWGFLAPEHWSKVSRVQTNVPLVSYPNVSPVAGVPAPAPKTHFFDGQIGAYQERAADGSIAKLWIYPTMRRGGNSVYAFNVTSKPSTTNQPSMLWRYDNSASGGDVRMGESWSTPVIIRVKGISQPLVVFGAGHHTCEDAEDANTACTGIDVGKGIVIMDAQSGKSESARYRFIGVETGGLDSSAGRFVADIMPVDVDRDGYTDVLYAADTRGNIWRINTSKPSDLAAEAIANWKVTKVATVSDWAATAEKRKFMYAPSVVALGTQVTILIGSGDREKPSASSSASTTKNRFYGIRDDISQTSLTPAIGYGTGAADTSTVTDHLLDVTSLSTLDATTLGNVRGWFRNLYASTDSAPYEQVVTTPVTLAGVTYFNTYQAKDSNSNTCTNLGTGRAYQVSFQTGLPPKDASLSTTFVTEGIPPSPVGGLVLVDGKTVPFIIGGPGATPISPAKIKPTVSPDRRPVYRYRRID